MQSSAYSFLRRLMAQMGQIRARDRKRNLIGQFLTCFWKVSGYSQVLNPFQSLNDLVSAGELRRRGQRECGRQVGLTLTLDHVIRCNSTRLIERASPFHLNLFLKNHPASISNQPPLPHPSVPFVQYLTASIGFVGCEIVESTL